MTDKREATEGGRHMAASNAGRFAVEHPGDYAAFNSYQPGYGTERADGKYSLTINGNHLIFHKPHGKHLDARQVADLRHYFALSGVSPDNPYGTPATAEPSSVDVVVLIDHHAAKLYRIQLSSDQRAETVAPYDPHHFLHHLHHRDEVSEHGQRPALAYGRQALATDGQGPL
jgi:hypothetical protein